MEVAIKLSGILFGVLARTLTPYLRKLKQGKVKEFKNGYWASAAAAVKLFCAAFGFGFAWNSLVNEAAKWTEKKSEAK